MKQKKLYDDGTLMVLLCEWPKDSGHAQADCVELWIDDRMIMRRQKSQIKSVLDKIERLQHSLSNSRTILRALEGISA